MNRNRNNRANLDADGEIFGFIPARLVKNVGVAEVFGFLVLLWVTAVGLHIAYNAHFGWKHSAIQIEKQTNLHKSCNENEIVRERYYSDCETARIEKDLSASLMTVNYVLRHTTVCVVSNCYDIFTDAANRLGWLLIGIGVVLSLLLCVFLRSNVHFEQHASGNSVAPQQQVLLLDSPQHETLLRKTNRVAASAKVD